MENSNILSELNFNIPSSNDFQTMFKHIANQIMNNYYLVINNTKYEIIEIEFYYYKPNCHEDNYTHQHHLQRTNSQWYLHRTTKTSNTIKNGRRKGLDITIGDSDKNIYGGILIRIIKNVDEVNVIDGPALTVNRIMKNLQINDIKELSEIIENCNVFEGKLKLEKKDIFTKRYIYSAERIGLSPTHMSYFISLYRFVTIDTSFKGMRKTKKEKIIKNAIENENRNRDLAFKDLGYKIYD